MFGNSDTDEEEHSVASSKPENEIFDLSSREFKKYIRNLSPYEFEHFVADVWEAQGWTTEVTSGSNDRGIDVTATNATNDKQLIQVKRYSENNKVGSQEVRKYATLYQQEDNVDAVVIVTASSFTKQGRELAHDLDVKAIDNTRLYQIVNDINHLDAVEEDYQAQSSGVESSNTEPDSINFQDVEEDVMSILQDSSDLMGKVQKAAQYDGIEAQFARNGREQDLKKAVAMHEIWIEIIDQCFTLAERTRNLPADSLPDDYWTLMEIQIGIFESLGESLAQGLRYKEKLLNTRLLGSPIDIGKKQGLSFEDLDISPMAQEDIDTLKRKQDKKIIQAAEYIEEIQNLSEKRKRILSRYA